MNKAKAARVFLHFLIIYILSQFRPTLGWPTGWPLNYGQNALWVSYDNLLENSFEWIVAYFITHNFKITNYAIRLPVLICVYLIFAYVLLPPSH